MTGLLPDQCACKDHRNSPGVMDLGPLQVSSMIEAIYDGRCAIDARHEIKVGDEIWHIKTPPGEGVGWACAECSAAVING